MRDPHAAPGVAAARWLRSHSPYSRYAGELGTRPGSAQLPWRNRPGVDVQRPVQHRVVLAQGSERSSAFERGVMAMLPGCARYRAGPVRQRPSGSRLRGRAMPGHILAGRRAEDAAGRQQVGMISRNGWRTGSIQPTHRVQVHRRTAHGRHTRAAGLPMPVALRGLGISWIRCLIAVPSSCHGDSGPHPVGAAMTERRQQ